MAMKYQDFNSERKNCYFIQWNQIVYHKLTQDMFKFAYVINSKCNKSYLTWSVLHGGCNNVCRITWGGGGKGNSKWQPVILHEIKYLVFHNYFVFFGKKKKIFFQNSRFPIRSVFVINVSLITSVVCYCQNGLRRKHGKCSLCNKWWHSFMNQRLNHLVLLYKKCNCIIMSLNTYNKNVDIIWHYCIISQIKLHGFWKRSALTNMKKDALKYMINRLWLGIFHIACHRK